MTRGEIVQLIADKVRFSHQVSALAIEAIADALEPVVQEYMDESYNDGRRDAEFAATERAAVPAESSVLSEYGSDETGHEDW